MAESSRKSGGGISYLCLQDRIGYLFQDPSLLERALTHPSSTSEDNRDNERMEFLGDSVVNLCVAQALYEQHPCWSEGDLTQVKSAVVSTLGLARAAESLCLRDVGRFGKGLPQDEPLPPSVYANLFEAIAAAVYLDGGLLAARAFILRVLNPDMKVAAENGGEPNPKSMLQHLAQKYYGVTPYYRLVGSTGPDHGKIFQICAYVGGRVFQAGTGRSKKEAEQAAARCALDLLEVEIRERKAAAASQAEADAAKGAQDTQNTQDAQDAQDAKNAQVIHDTDDTDDTEMIGKITLECEPSPEAACEESNQ